MHDQHVWPQIIIYVDEYSCRLVGEEGGREKKEGTGRGEIPRILRQNFPMR